MFWQGKSILPTLHYIILFHTSIDTTSHVVKPCKDDYNTHTTNLHIQPQKNSH